MTNLSKLVASKYTGKDLVIGVDSSKRERPTPKQPRVIKFS